MQKSELGSSSIQFWFGKRMATTAEVWENRMTRNVVTCCCFQVVINYMESNEMIMIGNRCGQSYRNEREKGREKKREREMEMEHGE